MKTFTCKDLGGVCDAALSGETAEEVGKKGYEHVQSSNDEAHKELFKGMQGMSDEDSKKWNEDFQKKFDEKEEN